MRSRMIGVTTLSSILLLGAIWPPFNYAQVVPPLEPPGVHARIFDKLEKKIAVCDPTTDVQRCVLDTIWRTADVTTDGKISVAEINRLFRIVAAGLAYQDYVASHHGGMTSRRGVPVTNHELDSVIVAGSVGAIVTPALIANFDYNSDGMLSRTELLGDSKFANWVSAVEKQRTRFPDHLAEAFGRLRNELFGTTAKERDGHLAKEPHGGEGKPTEREMLAEFCAVVPQSTLCRGQEKGQVRTERRGQDETPTDRRRLAEFCAEVPQSALCRDL